MALSPIKKRSYGYELAGFEKALIFDEANADIGFVRFRDQARGIFYLDPSLYEETPADKVYFMNPVHAPSKGQFIRVTEKEKIKPLYEQRRGAIIKTEIYEVLAWEETEQNSIKGPLNMDLEEFLDTITMPLRRGVYDVEDLGLMFGLYTVACPPLATFEKGGIDVLIQSKYYETEKANAVKRINEVIPKEFSRINSRNYYNVLTTTKRPATRKSREISLEFINTPSVPAHININFDVEFKAYGTYKEYFNAQLPAARSFLIDALMFDPKINDEYLKTFQEAMPEMKDAADTMTGDRAPLAMNYGDTLPRLALAFARLNFQKEVNKEDIKRSLDLYLESSERAAWSAVTARKRPGYYTKTADEKRLIAEIYHLKDTGQPLTISGLRKITSLPPVKYEKTLEKLHKRNDIYLPGGGRIEIIEN